ILDEAGWVADRAAALLAGPPGCAPDGAPWPDGRQARVRPSDIAVLCRKRSQFVPLRHALEARGIPVEVVGLGGLLGVPEVQGVVCTVPAAHGGPCRRGRTWWPRGGCATTRAPPPRWPGCPPGRAGGSGRATWSRSAA